MTSGIKNVFIERVTPKIAYLIGAYLGDGYITSTRASKWFGLQSIDLDFAKTIVDYAADDVCATTPPTVINRVIRNKPRVFYQARINCTDFCDWLLKITKDKTIVPDCIPLANCEITKNFCEGFLDSEGWIAMSKQPRQQNGNHAFQGGFGCTNRSILLTVAKMLQLLGVKMGNLRVAKMTDGRKDCYSFCLNIRSLLSAKIYFRIKRKRDRLHEFSDTKRHCDRYRDCMSGSLLRDKRQSDLQGNLQPT